MARSTRTRVKSQRALDSEDTNRLLAQAKKAAQDDESAAAEGPAAESSTAAVKRSTRKKKAVPGKAKKKGKEEEVWCICKSSEGDTPMIECGVCNDWFHFACVDLDPSDADQIHKYVCPNCQEATGEKTTRTLDISNIKSPTPPPGVIKPLGKRKQPAKSKLKQEEASDNPSESESSDDDASSASHSDSSASAKGRSPKKARTIPTRSKDEPSKSPTVTERKPSLVARKSSTSAAPKSKAAELPAARSFVLSKFTGVVKDLFPEWSEDDVQHYVVEMESGLWRGFKELKDGKDVAGARYKTQFNLLASSLNSSLRTDTYNAITTRELKPSEVAMLTSAELASQERHLELEKAKEEALRQTVKVKERAQPNEIRLGRDGFEKVEDAREKELSRLAEAEEEAREREKRRKEEEARAAEEAAAAANDKPGSVSATPVSKGSESMKPPSHRQSFSGMSPTLPKSPTISSHPLGPRRSESREDVSQSPRNSISLTSAWGGGDRPKEESLSFSADQTLDLSDLVAEPEDVDMEPAEQDEMAAFQAKEVVWSGQIHNPTDKSTAKATVEARLIARPAPPPTSPWSLLLPTPTIEVVGRVPVKTSLDFIRASRLNPNRELFTVAFSPIPASTAEQLAAWDETINFFIEKDRHAVCHLYGKSVPRNAIQELYLIPLGPEDPSPDVTDLLDGYSLPGKRPAPVMVGVFIGHKENLHHAAAPVPPSHPVPPPSAPASAHSHPQVISPPPVIPNLDPGMLNSLLALTNPGASSSTAPAAPLPAPYAPAPAYHAPPQGYYPPPGHNSGHHNASLYANPPSHAQYAQGGHSPYDMPRSPHDPYGGRSPYDQQNEGGWNRRPPPSGPSRGQDRFRGMQRDNGWGSRGR